MDDQQVLHHLLEIEAQAAAMVEEAQAAADLRVAEAERQERAHYEKSYGERLAELEAQAAEKVRELDLEYHRRLAAYREELQHRAVDGSAFDALLKSFLLGAE